MLFSCQVLSLVIAFEGKEKDAKLPTETQTFFQASFFSFLFLSTRTLLLQLSICKLHGRASSLCLNANASVANRQST